MINMKRNILYALMGCFIFTFCACSDSYEDATSKHVYGEDENPYLRVNLEGTATLDMEFPIARLEPKTVNLKDYAEKFHKSMGMTVDEAIAGLTGGEVVYYNISTAKNCWVKTAPTKGSAGWYYNESGVITTSENAVASVDFDATEKTLTVSIIGEPAVGTSLTVNVGFAVNNGKDYDDYVRFCFNIVVSDPGSIVVSNTIPTGNYSAFLIEFAKYADAIETCLEMTVAEFSKEVTDKEGAIAMYIVDVDTDEWDMTSSYTANGIGYWVSSTGVVCGWGDTGATYFIETEGDGAGVNIGRREDIPAGEVYKMKFVYANKADNSKYIQFIVTATME